MDNIIYITTDPVDTFRLEKELSDPTCGGVVTFTGKVRNHHEGRAVVSLAYEAYIPMAESVLKKIAETAQNKFGVQNIHIVHRVGSLAIGDVAVWIGVASAHRGEAFMACQYAIDELKGSAPIWKKEFYSDKSQQWVLCSHKSTRQNLKTAIILAGGQSERFGSDKIWTEFEGKSLVCILIDTLQKSGFDIVLSGPAKKLSALGLRVIEDDQPFAGPLMALASVFKQVEAENILVIAADMPFVSEPVIAALWKLAQSADLAQAHDSNGGAPLPAVYGYASQKAILKLTQTGKRALKSLWDENLQIKILEPETLQQLDREGRTLVNINTLADFENIKLKLPA